MREIEIKFRGRRISDGKWMYGDLLHIVGGYVIYHGSQTESQLIEDRSNVAIELYMDEVSPVLPETVGQYTGLRDKDGKEIYEGDILNIDFKNEPMYVDYVKDGFMACRKGSLSDFLYTVAADSRIVGNIHDNPDLLR